jgi:hypothetical protein
LVRGLERMAQREQWRFTGNYCVTRFLSWVGVTDSLSTHTHTHSGDVEEIADPLCQRYLAGDDLINAGA